MMTIKNCTHSVKLFVAALALVWVSVGTANAQDIHFSQYYMSPLNLNPALTGVMNCNYRVIANYRDQWASVLKANSFKTFAASFDMSQPVGRSDFWGGGISLWGDRAGSSNFSTITGKISGSYSKRMGGYRRTSHYLVVGAEAGLAQRSLSFINLRYGNQNNNGVYDGGLASGETADYQNFLFGDVGAGVLWFSNFDDNSNFYIGAAGSHLNRANQSFSNTTFEGLYSKFTIHGGGEFMFNNRIGLAPNFAVLLQGPSYEADPGTNVKFDLSKNKRERQVFQIGAFARLSNHYQKTVSFNDLIVTTRFDYNNVGLGFSYDINTSEFNAATNGNGGFEFNLMYKICDGFKRADYCPNF